MSAMLGRALPPIPGQDGPPTNMDFLLPTGVMVPMVCSPRITLREAKELLYKEAKQYPLYSLLKDQGFYNFMGISADGEKEEFVNESHTIEDLGLFIPMLKLVERQGNQKEKLLNAEIGNLIGRRLHDFDVMGVEVQDFRRNILTVCEQAVQDRTSSTQEAVHYHYPPRLVKDEGEHVQAITIDVFYVTSDGKSVKTSLPVDGSKLPNVVIEMALKSKELRHLMSRSRANDIVLKVVGREEYLLDHAPLTQYKYIQQCLAQEVCPRLSLKPFNELVPKEKEGFIRPVHASTQPAVSSQYGQRGSYGTLTRTTAGSDHSRFVSVWEVKETYRVKIVCAKNINVAENHKVYVRAAIYHGGEPLCPVVCTSRGAAPENAEWNEILEFDIPVKDLPRAAKLCFVILGATDIAMGRKAGRRRKQAKDIAPVAWVNMAIFDYASKLQSGSVTLYAWPIQTELEESINYMGSTTLNPSTTECVSLGIEIPPPSLPPHIPSRGKPIMYPSYDQIRAFAHEVSQVAIPAHKFPTVEVDMLHKVVDQDPLAQLDEQDKELIWRMRNVCLKDFPHSLPKVLQSISWNNRSDVAQLYVLLDKWPKLSPEVSMELLDYQYADITLRGYAVNCMEVLSDDKLLMYLLQLVQVLKFESYLDCALGQFLLRRALSNMTIGHFFFWHLRSEMHLPIVSVRFGLMLEAYCRGCGGAQMEELTCELAALNKMEQVTSLLQTLGKKKSEELLKCLKEPHFTTAMENITSPLDPMLHCKALVVEKCKVMDSKMRPLWLVFQNEDSLGDSILQIFKNGDDLRQDMLTLQIMGIMDSQWKQAGLDLRMNPYGCLSTGAQVGMIEVVLSASTIAKIQKKKGARGAFDKKLLYQWLRDQNPDPAAMEKAIDNFTYSCAGCCVATYVLGIGDRHSDNIMLRTNGQLVHIDFGHFLGNFKSKFGVKRERVPFVLTSDFIYIITKEGDRDSPEFAKFKRLCEDAFLRLRDRGPLFINLFSMMLSCGIPELRNSADISYIRDALCLGESQDVALENFRKKLQEAIKNSWSVSLNWYIHNVARTGN